MSNTIVTVIGDNRGGVFRLIGKGSDGVYYASPDGSSWEKLADAAGITPSIDSSTGHWFVGTSDTGISATGPAGAAGAAGAAGSDGAAPHIDSATNHWFVGTSDTGVSATGPAGAAASAAKLDDLQDVSAAAPSGGQALVWNLTSSAWVPGTVLLPDTVAASDTAVTSAYTADYSSAAVHRIVLGQGAACSLTVTNVPEGKALVIRADNTSGGTVSFNSSAILASSSTGIRYLVFANAAGTVEFVQ